MSNIDFKYVHEARAYAGTGNVDELKKLVAEHTVKVVDTWALLIALNNAELETIKYLEGLGVTLSGLYTVALEKALKKEDSDAVSSLVTLGCKLTDYNEALISAVSHDSTAAVLKLLDSGSNPTEDQVLLLSTAVSNNNPDIFDALVKHGADYTDAMSIPLKRAVYDNQVKMLEHFQKQGIDLSELKDVREGAENISTEVNDFLDKLFSAKDVVSGEPSVEA